MNDQTGQGSHKCGSVNQLVHLEKSMSAEHRTKDTKECDQVSSLSVFWKCGHLRSSTLFVFAGGMQVSSKGSSRTQSILSMALVCVLPALFLNAKAVHVLAYFALQLFTTAFVRGSIPLLA